MKYKIGDSVINNGKSVTVTDIVEIEDIDYYVLSDGKTIHCKFLDITTTI